MAMYSVTIGVISAVVVLSSMVPAYGSLVPALYVFGDSTVDGGNTIPFFYHGIDLNLSSLAPRWSNGLVISDFIAILLGLPLAPPSKNYTLAQASTTGINYAYAGAGILPETRKGTTWSFDIQISNFSSSIDNHLSKAFSQPGELSYHLSKSIFLISFGINDYYVDYDSRFNESTIKEPIDAAYHLLDALSQRLSILYQMGARKFVINNIWPMGCMPDYHLNNISVCNGTSNDRVLPFSILMPSILWNLSVNLPGFDYTYSDDFSFVQDLNLNTAETGITNTTGMCWNMFAKNPYQICQNRDRYVYFDNIHTTQVVNKLFAVSCFNGTLCAPKNIVELAGA